MEGKQMKGAFHAHSQNTSSSSPSSKPPPNVSSFKSSPVSSGNASMVFSFFVFHCPSHTPFPCTPSPSQQPLRMRVVSKRNQRSPDSFA